MPSAWSLIDASFPTFTGEERVRDQCNVMLNYMYMLAEGLKYQLSNLNAQNFNSTALKNIQTETTADVEEQVAKILEELNTIQNRLGTISSGLNELTQWKGTTEKALTQMQETLTGHGKTLESHGEYIDKAKKFIAPDDSGGGTVGAEGAEVHLVGKVYINGTLVE